MTQDDIIRMAREAGLYERLEEEIPGARQWDGLDGLIERFFNLATAHEREACAQIADKFHTPMGDSVADLIGAQIRARGQQ